MDRVTHNLNLHTGSVEQKRKEIHQYFDQTFTLYERLFETLATDDAHYLRPQPLRHPLIFYFGHTAVFFVNKLMLARGIASRVDPSLESLFAIGVDEMSWDDLNDDHHDWPEVARVRAYRDRVRQLVGDYIKAASFSLPVGRKSPLWPVMMGIEHERIHLETSSVLLRQTPLGSVKRNPLFDPCRDSGSAPENTLVPVSGARVELGKRPDHFLYGWDNEYGHAAFDVPDFFASRYLVSNREYLEFVEDGGYQTDQWWDAEGLGWRDYHRAMMPEFWRLDGQEYLLRLMTEEVPMPWDWPVEVCCLEAQAFCRWKSARTGRLVRLPDEAEYRRLAEVAGVAVEHFEHPIDANWNLEHFASSMPVNRFAHGEFFDVVGNVWQWNQTPIYAFDGFEVDPLYDDFSVPTFDNRHNLLKGGSWISTGNEIALHSRYAFRRHFYQHAGFRYVASERVVQTQFDVYETDEMLAQYCEFHYGEPGLGVPSFHAELARIARGAVGEGPKRRALDLGCAVGRIAFELARDFDQVDALDFSARFIQIGARMQERGSIRYERKEEGDLVSFQQRSLSDLGLDADRGKVKFMQQDATNLKPIYTGYDLVVAANLIDRLGEPRLFLEEIPKRMNPRGVLLIASPYTWLEQFTKKEHWLGGFRRDGEPVTTLDGLHEALDGAFDLIGNPSKVPFVIRETANKHQHTFSEITLWRKKG